MDPDIINDTRLENGFRNVTFSKFQKSKAKQELLKCLCDNKIENACYWSAEFICAGHFLDLWDIIIFYYCKYIHAGNPKLPLYLVMRYENFTTILNNGSQNDVLALRNNKKIRRLFGEIICILCYSTRRHIYQDVKLNKTCEFDLTNISDRFKAPSIKYVEAIFKDDDPKELFIPINELIFNLETKNVVECCYWYEWILEYETICKKKKKKCACPGRVYAPNNNQHDIVWIIWDVIFHYSKGNPVVDKIVNALYRLFTIRYNPTFKRKRKYIVYFCFALLIEKMDYDVVIVSKTEEIEAIIQKIDAIYREIKKNEIAPKTDYLYANLKKSNAEKTMEKIELMNSRETQVSPTTPS